jgi:hypothetical protein
MVWCDVVGQDVRVVQLDDIVRCDCPVRLSASLSVVSPTDFF